MKEHINFIKSYFDTIFESKPHGRWEFLKYEIRKFTIRYSKTKARKRREKKLEGNLRTLEQGLKNDKNMLNYKKNKRRKEELSMIYDEIGNGIKVRSRCNWYEFGEKSNKFFLNLKKKAWMSKYVTKYYIKK